MVWRFAYELDGRGIEVRFRAGATDFLASKKVHEVWEAQTGSISEDMGSSLSRGEACGAWS